MPSGIKKNRNAELVNACGNKFVKSVYKRKRKKGWCCSQCHSFCVRKKKVKKYLPKAGRSVKIAKSSNDRKPQKTTGSHRPS